MQNFSLESNLVLIHCLLFGGIYFWTRPAAAPQRLWKNDHAFLLLGFIVWVITCTGLRAAQSRGFGASVLCVCFIKGRAPTSALYIRMSPWLTLDQVGTALMFHSWLECSANGPVFIWNAHMGINTRQSRRRVFHSQKLHSTVQWSDLNLPRLYTMSNYNRAIWKHCLSHCSPVHYQLSYWN